MATTASPYSFRPIPLRVILFAAFAVHGPLLFMQLPDSSYDESFHVFFASHYAKHWFNPWNEKWFAGFSQTSYPPLTHQWIAMFSKLIGLDAGYMLVQLIAILLLTVGVYRFAKLWVDERAASYAALASIFIGALSTLVYQAGQLATVASIALFLNALPYFYEWSAEARGRSLIKGLVVSWAAAAAHHVTLIFGVVLFAAPVLWLACIDTKKAENERTLGGVISRAVVFCIIAGIGIAAVLLPYWIELIQHPIRQMPIPHASRSNYLLSLNTALNYIVVPYGALLLALPYVVVKGWTSPRLRPLLFGFWLTFLFGLGGTTPVPHWLLGRAFEVLTFERFAFWALLLMLPIVGILITGILDRFRGKGAVGLSLAAVLTFAAALGWLNINPNRPTPALDIDPVVEFLNRDNHNQYRYLTLGFGNSLSKVSRYANADSVDGDYNSARLLPELTHYASAQLTNSKFYGAAGMESLRAMLMHANRYGLKYIFVHDPYYEPLLTFSGWREIESYNNGEVTTWSKDDVPPLHPISTDARPAPWEGVLWGILPIGSSFLAILVLLLLPARGGRQSSTEPLAVPFPREEHYIA